MCFHIVPNIFMSLRSHEIILLSYHHQCAAYSSPLPFELLNGRQNVFQSASSGTRVGLSVRQRVSPCVELELSFLQWSTYTSDICGCSESLKFWTVRMRSSTNLDVIWRDIYRSNPSGSAEPLPLSHPSACSPVLREYIDHHYIRLYGYECWFSAV